MKIYQYRAKSGHCSRCLCPF